MAEILVTEAALRTLSVTIESLTVSGKQMTLAVFRQLPEADIYADDGNLMPYRFWGLVRYSIKDEGALWAVFENKNSLYRGAVNGGPIAGQVLRGSRIESEEETLSRWRGVPYMAEGREFAKKLEEVASLWRAHEAWVPWRDAMILSNSKLHSLPQLFIAV